MQPLSGNTSRAMFAGAFAAPFYLTSIIALGALEPGFDHRTSMMSLLGGIPGWRGLAFNFGVGLTGLLIILFALGLVRGLPQGWPAKVGTALLVVGGLGMVGAGAFPCAPGCVNILVEPNITGRLHITASLMAGMGSGLALFFFWAAMRGDAAWHSFAAPTLAAAIFSNLPGITMWVTLATDYRLHAVEGLLQRLGFVVVLIWMAFAALQLRRISLDNSALESTDEF